jgi:hypothetical protein
MNTWIWIVIAVGVLIVLGLLLVSSRESTRASSRKQARGSIEPAAAGRGKGAARRAPRVCSGRTLAACDR